MEKIVCQGFIGLSLLLVLCFNFKNGKAQPLSILNTFLANTNGKAEIVHVTNLNADGPGSFKEAVTGGSSDITRIVVFDVSGECELPIEKGDIHKQIEIRRENLWIAGQTAPDPGDGTGRGFTLKGRLSFRRGYLVVEHIRVQPIDGHPDPDNEKADARGITVFPNASFSRLGKNEFFLFRNVTVRWTQDVCMAVSSWKNKKNEYSYPENIVIDNCLFAEPLNQHMDLSKEDGYLRGWNRGFNFRGGAHRGLFRGNLHASAIVRVPQVTQGATALIVNNYTFNFGTNEPGSSFLWPMHLNPKHADHYGFEQFEEIEHTLLVGVASNYGEAGNKTKLPGPPYTYAGAVSIDNEGPVGPIGPNQWWDDGKNKVVSYYDPSTAPMDKDVNEFNPNLAETPFYEKTAGAPVSEHLEIVSEPPFPLPGIVFTPDEAKEHCLTYAGAWPGYRDPVDARIIREVKDKTHSPAATSEIGYTPVSTVMGTPPSIPYEPADGQLNSSTPLLQKEGNGLTVLENWLISQHVNAGGCLETAYTAAEWLTYDQIAGLRVDHDKPGQFVVYPNPSKGLFSIESEVITNNDVEINVFDIRGNKIMSKPYSAGERMTFFLDGHAPGMYFVEINVNGQQILKKLILNL